MRNAIFALVLVAAAMGAGCGGISSKMVTLPSGEYGYSIKCDKKHNDWGDCYTKAAEVCGGKYEILEKNSNDQSVLLFNAGNPFGTTIPRRSIIIRCE